MKFSRQALKIKSSPTLSLNEKTKKLQAQGKPVINLGVGEPTNLTPFEAKEKAATRLETRMIKYSPSGGSPDLKNAVIQYTTREYGLTPDSKNILITNGAKQAIFNTLVSILNPEDEVVLMAPYWVSYPEMIKMACGKPVIVQPNDGKLIPEYKDVLAKITPQTKAIILNNPNNPSGLVFQPDFVAQMVGLCEQNEIYLIMDDIYHQLVYGETAWIPGYNYSDRDINSSYIVVINGISKTYGMTGFRIGWAIGSRDLIKIMTNIQSQTTSGVSIILQDAAVGALTGSQKGVSELRENIEKNKDATIEELLKINNINVEIPEGAFYCLPNFSVYNNDSMELSNHILENALVAVVPGVVFGMEGHLRISYAGRVTEIREAIQRIRWALDTSSPKKIQIGNKTFERTLK